MLHTQTRSPAEFVLHPNGETSVIKSVPQEAATKKDESCESKL